jgi:hypothetical protein
MKQNRVSKLLLLVLALCWISTSQGVRAQGPPKGNGGITYTMQEAQVWATRLGLQGAGLRRYYTQGDMLSLLGSKNQYSPADGSRILSLANDFKNNASTREADRYVGASLVTSSGRVIGSSSTGEPGLVNTSSGNYVQGNRLRDCAFVSLCYRAIGDNTNAQAYATPVITELLWHATNSLYDFSNTTRWSTTNLIGSTNPLFPILGHIQRLYKAFDYVRPYVSSGDKTTINLFFKRAADFAAVNVNGNLNKRFGSWNNSSQVYTSGYAERMYSAVGVVRTNPYFESFSNAQDALSSYGAGTASGTTYQHYYNSTYSTNGLQQEWNNRYSDHALICAYIGIDQNDNYLTKTAEFYYKEYLCYSTWPNGEVGDDERSWRDSNSGGYTDTQADQKTENSLNYKVSVAFKLTQLADVFHRNGKGNLFAYTTTKGAYTTTGTAKSLELIWDDARKYYIPSANGGYARYNTNTSGGQTSTRLIDGVDLTINSGGNSSDMPADTWLAYPNKYYKNSTWKNQYERTLTGTRNIPQWPRANGANLVWFGHAGSYSGVLFMYGATEENASPYTTAKPMGLALFNPGNTTLDYALTAPDDRTATVYIEISTNGTTWTPKATVTSWTGTELYGTLSSLSENTVYYVRARAESLVGLSDWSDVNNASTLSGTTVPNAPTVLIARYAGIPVAAPAVRLRWFDNATDETGYEVERATGSGSFSLLTTLAAGSTTYLDATVSKGNTYRYQVRAVKSGVYSAYSNVAIVILPPGWFNFALAANGATVTANTSYGNYAANYAIDGDSTSITNRFVTANKPASFNKDIVIDLGETVAVKRVVLFTGRGDRIPARNYRLYAWNGSSWISESIYEYKSSVGSVRNENVFSSPVSTSKVRIVFYDPGQASLVEFKVFDQ